MPLLSFSMADSLHFTVPTYGSPLQRFPSSVNRNFCVGSSSNFSDIPKERGQVPLVIASAVSKFSGFQTREQILSDMIVEKVSLAKEICKGNEKSQECKVAWDEVEEVSQAKAHLRQRSELYDPLESFCKDNPESDECRVYED